MRNTFLGLFSAGLAFLLTVSLPVRAASMDRMEEVVSKAGSLNAFLSDDTLIDEYFTAAQKYYGKDRFPRVAYDSLIHQIKEVSQSVPGFKERAWETTDLGLPYQIETSLSSSGRNLGVAEWEKYWGNFLSTLRETSLSTSGAPLSEVAIRETIRKLDLKIQTFEEKLLASSATRKIVEQARADFYREIAKSPDVGRIAANRLLKYLSKSAVTDLLGSGNAEVILDVIGTLQANPAVIFAEDEKVAGVFVSSARSQLPSAKKLLENTQLFPRKMVQTNRGKWVVAGSRESGAYEFKPIARRFHGFFKGIDLGECVGGNCKTLERLTPERWATTVLKDSQLHFLEKDGSYLGFVQTIPIEKDGKIYGSVDFGAPALKQMVKEQVGEQVVERPLFYQWMKVAPAHLPSDWEGFVVGESQAIGNAGVIQKVQVTPHYVLGKTVGPSSSFSHLDKMAENIVTFGKSQKLDRTYGGRMIFDGMVPGAKELTLLREPSAEVIAAVFGEGDEKKKNWLMEKWFGSAALSERLEVLQEMERRPSAHAEMVRLLKLMKGSVPAATVERYIQQIFQAKSADVELGQILEQLEDKTKAADYLKKMIGRAREPRDVLFLNAHLYRQPWLKEAQLDLLRRSFEEKDKTVFQSLIEYLRTRNGGEALEGSGVDALLRSLLARHPNEVGKALIPLLERYDEYFVKSDAGWDLFRALALNPNTQEGLSTLLVKEKYIIFNGRGEKIWAPVDNAWVKSEQVAKILGEDWRHQRVVWKHMEYSSENTLEKLQAYLKAHELGMGRIGCVDDGVRPYLPR